MTPDAATHPVFAVAEAGCLVLAFAALARPGGSAPRFVPPFLGLAALALAIAPAAAVPRGLAAMALLATAAVLPAAADRMAHLRPPSAAGGAAGTLARLAAGLGLAVLAAIFAATSRPSGEPVAIALATVLVGLLAASLPAPEPARLVRLGLPCAAVALLAANLPGAPGVLLVLPAALPLPALLLGSAILRRIAAIPGEP